MYKQTRDSGTFVRTTDNAFVPADHTAVMEWLDAGNTPAPADILVRTAKDEIVALEASNPITHGALRETILAVGQIAAQLTGRPMESNPAISRILELEAQIDALRRQQ